MIIETALVCLALNIYHEARGEPLAGRSAVTEVVLNRASSAKFPDTICEVVKEGYYYQGSPVRNKCQFSWWCDGKSDQPKDKIQWAEAVNLARTMLNKSHVDITEGSLYYHSTKVDPYWSKHYSRTVKINNHIFYR
jgi:N-acetylmuramoyl-L-alanine amidase